MTRRAGHKRPELPGDDLTATLDATREDIHDFSDALEGSTDSRDLLARTGMPSGRAEQRRLATA